MVKNPLTFTRTKLLVDPDASLSIQKPFANRRIFDGCDLRAGLGDQSRGRIEGFTVDRSTPILEGGVQEI